ncbi:MAG: ATPase [Candidatus Saccharibacteria bacterium]|nr:ATPase [Candidatus Saccharibacteria bacterium]
MSETTVTATPNSYEVITSREFNATKDKVFEAYTNPELFVQLMGPSVLSMKIESMDTVPGGKWRYVSTDPTGAEYGFHGVYHDVIKDERIVQTFEFEGVPGHVSFNVIRFDETDGKTTVTSTAVFETIADRDGMVSTGMESGARESFERLATLLAE